MALTKAQSIALATQIGWTQSPTNASLTTLYQAWATEQVAVALVAVAKGIDALTQAYKDGNTLTPEEQALLDDMAAIADRKANEGAPTT